MVIEALVNRILLCLSFIFCSMPISGQMQEFNHPELKWRTLELEHFFLHFHQGEERTASVVATIADEIYGPVTSFYHHVPDGKIHIVIRDHEDDSNGAAFYYDNKIEIWASAMDFVLRGNHHWLRNVVTHELVHIISLGAARKMPRQIPAVYFQWIGYEKEKRTDVIHGYPNTLVSFPLAGTVVPMWFAEGLTQTQIPGWNYDSWDSHRDMLLREAALDGSLLSLDAMGIFGKNSIGNEQVYNQGFGFVLFMLDRYGKDVLSELVRAMRPPLRFDFNGAAVQVLHKPDRVLYGEWLQWMVQAYRERIKTVTENLSEGIIVEPIGSGNFHPLSSPDGKRLAYITNRNKDYLSQTSLRIRYLRAPNKSEQIASGVSGSFSWSPDGNKIAYAKKVRNFRGSHFFDLFVYDLYGKKETRLSRSERIRDPDWSADGKMLICVSEKDGTSNLMLLNVIGKRLKPISQFKKGEQIFAPRWIGNTGRIVFSFSESGEGRDIAQMDSSGSNFRYLIRTQDDERDPYPAEEGQTIYFSSDKTGIFNIYRYDASVDTAAQITNVVGGAFMPSVDPAGRLLYSLFHAGGYKIAQMDTVCTVFKEYSIYNSPYQSIRERMKPAMPVHSTGAEPNIPNVPSRSYKPIFSKLSFLPRIMMDFPNKLKIGTYFSGSDFLDRISIFGGLSANQQWDTDAFGIFQYRILYPTLFVEAYQIRRHTSDNDYRYTFNLLESDVGADWPVSDNLSLRTVWQFSRFDAAQYFSVEGQRIKIPYTYHIGNVFGLYATYRAVSASVYSDVAPRRGRSIALRLERASQRFMEGFAVHQNYGTLIELYRRYDYNQVYFDWKEYLPGFWQDHAIALRLQAGGIDRPVDGFYHLFAGGMDGLKGYPYYSIGGTKMVQFGLAYRFAVVKNMGLRLLWLNMDNLFLSLYGQAGQAWEMEKIPASNWKRDAGAQLRVGFFSFYAFPMSLTFDAAYGLDQFKSGGNQYGGEWRYYFGLLFDFFE